MESELIDFSDREGEFLTSEVKQQVLGYAIITSVLGFVLSSWLFVHHKVGPAGQILDRKGAEGLSQAQTVKPPPESEFRSGIFHAPGVAGFRKRPAPQRPVWKDAADGMVAASESATETEEILEPKVLKTSLGVVPEFRRTVPSKPKPPQAVASEKVLPPKVSLDRFLFPRVLSRPEPSNLSTVESHLAANMVVLSDGREQYYSALVLDPQGRALISSVLARPDFLQRVWVHGKLRSAKLLATDSEFGLSLIQIEGESGFQAVPLSPVPPSTGEHLLGFAQYSRESRGQEFRAGMPFGKAGFFLDGRVDRTVFGTSLVNNRGELVGCYISALPGVPGSGVHLAADSSAIHRLLRGYRNTDVEFSGTEHDAVSTLLASLDGESVSEKSQRGRAIAGVGLSDFYLGMASGEAKKRVSAPKVTRWSADYELWVCPAPPVTLYFARGRLLAASTSSSSYSTVDGLAVGAGVDSGDHRRFFNPLFFSDLVSIPGLEIRLGPDKRVSEFVVKPSYLSR